MNIILIGAQGCGKGTQAAMLKERYGFDQISTGDLIRKAIKEKNPTALKMKEYSDKGKLAPNELVIQLVKENLGSKNLFDGFPRTLPQAEALDEVTQIDLVIELKILDDLAITRLSSRRQCKNCNAIFGLDNPPREEGKCNRCKGEIYQRADDEPEAIKKRLEDYRDQTEPLLEYYKPRDIVHSIDASKKIEVVFKEICDIIDKTA